MDYRFVTVLIRFCPLNWALCSGGGMVVARATVIDKQEAAIPPEAEGDVG